MQGFQAQGRVVALISLTLYNGIYTSATPVSRENTFSEVKCARRDRNSTFPWVGMGMQLHGLFPKTCLHYNGKRALFTQETNVFS